MCTVSFIARPQGYALAMNRDEQRSRVAGLPPQLREKSRGLVLCPAEPGGGTWLALNGAGVTFALINWYSIPQQPTGNSVSRGEVVNAVSDKINVRAVQRRLEELPLPYLKPFRLIGIFPEREEVVQWQWNQEHLTRQRHDWQAQQWISSGFDEPMAQRIRSRTFKQALGQKNAGSLGWLRRLHRSHAPKTGPFSTCMHRSDSVTVSYAEIILAGQEGTMNYFAGAPCACSPEHALQLRLPISGAV